MWRERVTNEDGIALVFAMFVVLALAGLAVLFVGNSLSSSRQSGIERNREVAIHAAESAAEDLFTQINVVEETFTATDTDFPLTGTDSAQRQWALDEAAAVSESDLVTSGSGQGYAIRPDDPSVPDTDCPPSESPPCVQPLDLVLTVGWSPSRQAWLDDDRNSRVRVVKMQITTGFFSPMDALFVCGDLTLGSATTQGIAGNVYVNGDVTTTGNSYQIDGDLSVTGTFGPDNPESPADQVTGTITIPAPPKDCPPADARSLYDLDEDDGDPIAGANPDRSQTDPYYGIDPVTTAPIFWYDLCPPDSDVSVASIRVPDPLNGPCAYDASAGSGDPGHVEWQEGQTTGSKGWSYVSGAWKATHVQTGIFYVYQRDATVTGGDGAVTIIVEKDPGGPGDESGNLDLSGGPTLRRAFSDLQFLAERDFEQNGNSQAQLNGVILVKEQLGGSGNANVNGSVVVRDEPDTHLSPVSSTKATGSMVVDNDGTLRVPVHDTAGVTFWNELR